MSYPGVSIVILNWNGIEDTVECLDSLRRTTYPAYETIVVDNGSEGDDVRVLRERYGDNIHFIENDRNYGFAEGSNIGMEYALRHCQPDYLLLLNNDMILAPNFLDELVKGAESENEIGIVGPKIYYYDFRGRDDLIWSAGGRIQWWRLWGHSHIGKYNEDLSQYQNMTRVDWVSGSAMMIKRRLIEELSFLDSRYFFGYEDVEYCLKARRYGYKTVYIPAARAWHKVGMSLRKRNPSLAFISDHYRFISRNFPAPVYIYHLLLIPLLLLQGVQSRLPGSRGEEILARFISRINR